MKFDFITDEKFRDVLERDFSELNNCIESKSSKSVLILCGSIIEAILSDYFLNFPTENLTKRKVLEMDLYPLIELAREKELISQSTKDLSTVIKNYRNLIHPGREIRKNERFDFDTALVAKSLLNIIAKEIRENYLNQIGYTAKDLIAKLENDSLSQPIFEKLLNKIHKNEKKKLYIKLIENEFVKPKEYQIFNPKKYLRILKSYIDREVVEKQLQKIIYKIETGEEWEVIFYYDLLYEDLNYLKEDEIELIILYILNAVSESSQSDEEIDVFVRKNIFSTFGTHITTEPIKTELFELVRNLVMFYSNRDYVYFNAYDQLINSLTSDLKNEISEYLIETVDESEYEEFLKNYDDGNYLPF